MGVGGAPRWCKLGRIDSVSGACLDPYVNPPNEDPANTTTGDPTLAGAIIPGVTIRAAQSCATYATPGADPSITGMSQTSFSLFFGATVSRPSAATGTPQAFRPGTPLTRPLPKTNATIDSWALIID